MVDYFVSPPDYTDLKIESSQLAQALQQRWPDVQFISRNDDANTLRWAINIAPGVKPLLTADVGDRLPCHQRFR